MPCGLPPARVSNSREHRSISRHCRPSRVHAWFGNGQERSRLTLMWTVASSVEHVSSGSVCSARTICHGQRAAVFWLDEPVIVHCLGQSVCVSEERTWTLSKPNKKARPSDE